MKIKKRLDQRVQELMPDKSKTLIQSWIMQGKISVDGTVCTKAGQSITEDAVIVCSVEEPRYVSRAGFKLEKALKEFGIDLKDKVALDAGLSTGGFTDCMLQAGIAKVFGVDVGYGQVHEKIRNDPRVRVMERTNLRELKTVGQLVDIVTLDLSFISVLKVMDAVVELSKPNALLVVLIKPQFEAEKHEVGKGGIIKDPRVHERVTQKVIQGIESCGYRCKGLTESPILGTTGNKEFLACFERLPVSVDQ